MQSEVIARHRDCQVTKRYDPPPATKFGPSASIQPKPAAGTPPARIAPPPTKFGAAATLQAKPKTTPAPADNRGQAYRPPAGIIQKMNRIKEEQTHNFLQMPDYNTEQTSFLTLPQMVRTDVGGIQTVTLQTNTVREDIYRSHVCRRIAYYAITMHKVGIVIQFAKGQNKSKKFREVTSDTAELQTGTGLYLSGIYKLDAAHLSNVSIYIERLAMGLTLTEGQKQALKDLANSSGATSPQLKRNNVGPDKVIDTCMTQYRHILDGYLKTNVILKAGDIIQELGGICIGALMKSPKAGESNYQSAIAGVEDAKKNSPWDLTDAEQWAREYDFI